MKFEDLEFKPKAFTGGNQAIVWFENGYGASVIDYGDGRKRGLYELAVIDDCGVNYSTDITSDVEVNLRPEDVTRLLNRIKAL